MPAGSLGWQAPPPTAGLALRVGSAHSQIALVQHTLLTHAHRPKAPSRLESSKELVKGCTDGQGLTPGKRNKQQYLSRAAATEAPSSSSLGSAPPAPCPHHAPGWLSPAGGSQSGLMKGALMSRPDVHDPARCRPQTPPGSLFVLHHLPHLLSSPSSCPRPGLTSRGLAICPCALHHQPPTQNKPQAALTSRG